MASLDGTVATPEILTRAAGRAQRTDARGFYAFMAVFFAAIVVLGFTPTTTALIDAVAAGNRPPPSAAPYLHAGAIVAWFLVLLLQTTQVATGRRALHRTLGMSALLLAPAIVAGMVLIVSQSWQGVASIPAGVDPQIVCEARHGAANFLVVQIRIVVLFTAFMLWAVATRRTDPDTHKRMMILATFALMSASVGRMRWLPGYDFPATSLAPASFGPAHLYHLGLLAPALAHDILRRGRPHRAYLIGLGLILSTMLATQLLWDYPWWMTAAPRLTGVPDMIR